LVAGAWAIQTQNESAIVREAASPLQCPAMNYGSAFSRAILMEGKGLRRLLISGTASIELGGQSINCGDLQKQIKMSLEVIQAILKSRGFDFSDVTRATGYFKDCLDASSSDWSDGRCRQTLIVQADICRPELLFEIEVDAILAS
jgi:enamine deaminase RidA (YjgF/YER057c/UK114 family)